MNARGLQTSRKHLTFRNEVQDRCFDWNNCVKTCNMSNNIKNERLKILIQKIIQQFPKNPLKLETPLNQGQGSV